MYVHIYMYLKQTQEQVSVERAIKMKGKYCRGWANPSSECISKFKYLPMLGLWTLQ